MDEQGQPAPNQPQLSRNIVTLQPGQSVMVTMLLDLNNFATGSQYETEIVLRENKFNQNICFKLCVEGFCHVPEAKPWDEDIAYKQFRGWQSHFTCNTKPTRVTVPQEVTALPDKQETSGIMASPIN